MYIPYYGIRDLAPFIIYLIYILMENRYIAKKYNPYTVKYPMTVLCISSLFLHIYGISIERLIGFKWTYVAVIEWTICINILYYIIYRNIKDNLKATMLSYLMSNFGGYLYEIPYFIKSNQTNILRMNDNNLLLINSQLLSLIVICYILSDLRYEVNLKTALAMIIYLVYFNIVIDTYWMEIIAYLTWDYWIHRIPMIIVLIIIAIGIKKK